MANVRGPLSYAMFNVSVKYILNSKELGMKYFLLSVLALVARGGAVTFELSGSANKCLFEDVHKVTTGFLP